ncbi:TonB-dependent receptor domain-containing protein [Sphingomonas sp. 28-63-12]|uniref:TonB-dependent receptor domain-containing protein n=1 Tax=Sphingomonas sp. 28-63-12 TaxID=1970434 RepID=UPI000BCDDA38|nr:MAG: TonB-dependent receptor [Sphingomonas sp. 28-63-12]
MRERFALGTLLLLTTQLVAPAALAQSSAPQTPPPATPLPADPAPTEEEQVEVSSPGFNASSADDIVVVGRNIPNTVRATPQVLSVLSEADIARTGEGDIAGALSHVAGLSVVGNGFVYVRGLGDRYSSALLNGSPLPSPEPLRRSVPLDIFPTSIVGSALIQKSYSANYSGEFGGGVVNLTTKAVPKESFLEVGGSVGYDSVSTAQFGYVYDGGSRDVFGYDDGTRAIPDFIRAAAAGGTGLIPSAQVAQLAGAQTSLLQSNTNIPVNYSGDVNFGHSFDVGSTRIGFVGSASWGNNFRTRDITQQDAVELTGNVRNDFRTVITDNRVVVNALLGLGLEFGAHKLRFTNIYIHDTDKQARGSAATVYTNSSGQPRFTQNTSWFERQLFETQGVGEFKFGDLSIDLRGAYANSKRVSPYERQFDYLFNPNAGFDATGNRIGAFQSVNAFGPFATVTFSELNENLYSGQADASYKLPFDRPTTISAGYYYSDAQRYSSRLPFVYQTSAGAGTSIPAPYNFFRPDYLLSEDVINNACPTVADGVGPGCVRLRFQTAGAGSTAYDASLRVNAGYIQGEAEFLDGLRAIAGVRYETADERVTPSDGVLSTRLNNDYWLPAVTVTWNFRQDMQLRGNFSETIARPQFRELAAQQYQDFESDRLYFGNPALQDSKLYNYELRYEWFYAREQRITVSGFFKTIDKPIEQVGFRPTPDARLQTGFSYVPSAKLYGVESEVVKYVGLDFLDSAFFATRRLVLIANYTWTKSSINADNSLVPDVGAGVGVVRLRPASELFRDGAALTGQSDHLVNVQVGIEDKASLSQLTFLVNYASKRITNRGPGDLSGVGFLPDIVEYPGVRFDVIARQGVKIGPAQFEIKLEGRNLTGTGYRESQTFANGTEVFINRNRVGRTVSLGITAKL